MTLRLPQVSLQIVAFYRAEESALSPRETERFSLFCCAYADDLLPFLRRCLQVLFPPAQLALLLGELQHRSLQQGQLGRASPVCASAGVPPTQLHRYGRLGGIQVPALLQPLHFLLPQREAWPPELAITSGSGGVTSEVDPEGSGPTRSGSED